MMIAAVVPSMTLMLLVFFMSACAVVFARIMLPTS
jgi:hypothetical protein